MRGLGDYPKSTITTELISQNTTDVNVRKNIITGLTLKDGIEIN